MVQACDGSGQATLPEHPRKCHGRLSSDVTLMIPRPLNERLRTVIEGTGFRSATEFCV